MSLLRKVKHSIFGLYLTNKYGYILKKSSCNKVDEKNIRTEYSEKMLEYLNIKVDVLSKINISNKENYLIISNHRGILDPLVVEVALKDLGLYGDWVAKKELANSIFFRLFVKNAGTILVDRNSKNSTEFFTKIKETLRTNNSIYIFPEGTRNKTSNDIIDFKGGTQLIALKNKVNILPIYIKTNTSDILKNTFYKNVEQHIEVQIGNIIPFKERKIEEAYKKEFSLK